ncbi:MAG: isoaspartyl peptidase/L-asparaginase [Burkholderiales bacterium]|nr:isoaspartyl peptidase/L-asparaginase [Burkholderiales bacterium]
MKRPGTTGAATGPRPRPRERASPRFTIALHGGAGVVPRAAMSRAAERDYRAALATALDAGYAVLAAGGTSLDAVSAAVVAMEDSPLFNAGRGAALTAEGTAELDAAIMDGASLRAGGVTLVTTVKNPVLLARLVMEETRHVLLGAHGADALARTHGLETVAPEYFVTGRRVKALERARRGRDREGWLTEADRHGTVGAVALDRHGNLAAATSTGGRTLKMAGRIGDSPIVGAGTYANNTTAAVSCTGEGEYFMRTLAAYSVSALMEYRGLGLAQAARFVLRRRLAPLGGSGGLVAVDRAGRAVSLFTTPGMYRASRAAGGPPVVAIYANDDRKERAA